MGFERRNVALVDSIESDMSTAGMTLKQENQLRVGRSSITKLHILVLVRRED